MKKFYIIFLVVVVVGMYFVFQPKKQPTKDLKFFNPDKILSTDIVIKITNKGFDPSEIKVKKGQRVVWVNETEDYVWPASDSHPSHDIYPEFDPKEPFVKGEIWDFTFDRVGDWGYHDHIRSSSRGIVHVE